MTWERSPRPACQAAQRHCRITSAARRRCGGASPSPGWWTTMQAMPCSVNSSPGSVWLTARARSGGGTGTRIRRVMPLPCPGGSSRKTGSTSSTAKSTQRSGAAERPKPAWTRPRHTPARPTPQPPRHGTLRIAPSKSGARPSRSRKAARDRHADALAASIEVRARQASLSEELARLVEERDLHERMLDDARSAAGSYTDVEPLAQAAGARQRETETALGSFNEALEAHTRMTEVETHRRQRLETVRRQWQNWDRRRAAAEQHVDGTPWSPRGTRSAACRPGSEAAGHRDATGSPQPTVYRRLSAGSARQPMRAWHVKPLCARPIRPSRR